jgi:hypothetical protein
MLDFISLHLKRIIFDKVNIIFIKNKNHFEKG